MKYDLISEEEYETIPDDDELYFVAFENICRRNMNSLYQSRYIRRLR